MFKKLRTIPILIAISLILQSSDTVIRQALEKDGVVFTHNNSVTLLTSGQEKFDDMFEAIRQAKSSVHLEYFNFRNDSIASALFDLLRTKAKEGVEVRALFDGFGNDSNNRPLKRSHVEKLRADGIEIYEFDPVRFPWVNHVFTRDHRKIVVIDGNVAYTGGMNVADYYIKGTEQVGSWRDMHCRIEGGAVSQLQMIFLRIWNKVTEQNVWGKKYFRAYEKVEMTGLKPDTTESAHKQVVGIVNREPRTTNRIIRDFYANAIDAAKDSIKLVNPYLTLSPRLKKALRKAAERGVKVEIMVSLRSDIPLTPDCVFYNVHQLMKHGCNHGGRKILHGGQCQPQLTQSEIRLRGERRDHRQARDSRTEPTLRQRQEGLRLSHRGILGQVAHTVEEVCGMVCPLAHPRALTCLYTSWVKRDNG